MYKVVELFVSINGEGRRAGELAIFVRFAGCNLNCSYCDTSWANKEDVQYTLMSKEDIYEQIKKANVKNVTLTGGEPLLQKDVKALLEYLGEQKGLRLEIETNGSIDVELFRTKENSPSFTIDYKLPGSDMEQKMCLKNFEQVRAADTVKFVCSSREDLLKAKEIIEIYNLDKKAAVYLSPVFGRIDPQDMVAFMIENNMNNIKLQLQLHKFIWDPEKRGV